jgi:hypothetical protein
LVGNPSPPADERDVVTDVGRRPGCFARLFFGAAGVFCLGLAALAAIIPLIPAFPFLAGAAACFAKSSPRFRDWLVNNKWLGPYLTGEGDAKAFSPGAKALTILILWVVGAVVGAFLLDGFFWRCGLVVTVLTLTIQILRVKPKMRPAAAALPPGAPGGPPSTKEPPF